MAALGELERAVMDHLWSSTEPQTVRQVHEALAALEAQQDGQTRPTVADPGTGRAS